MWSDEQRSRHHPIGVRRKSLAFHRPIQRATHPSPSPFPNDEHLPSPNNAAIAKERSPTLPRFFSLPSARDDLCSEGKYCWRQISVETVLTIGIIECGALGAYFQYRILLQYILSVIICKVSLLLIPYGISKERSFSFCALLNCVSLYLVASGWGFS